MTLTQLIICLLVLSNFALWIIAGRYKYQRDAARSKLLVSEARAGSLLGQHLKLLSEREDEWAEFIS